MTFPDQSHINHVRDALWQRSAGASIMVGAGFTKNADLARPGARHAPTWRDLGHAMCRKLYHADDRRRKRAIKEASGTSGLLRLAQEYETAFGKGQLHTFLEHALRLDDLRPSHTHRRLLRLPWRDVLTTNWDTLLERTRPSVVQRSYSIVQAMDHISSAAAPRIIKLHGTVPGSEHCPLIVTEEDYRTYPTKFAPFVNTVQQLMMETALLLIGFSGDDPNFLSWSGWVRDNLGRSAPKIYLAGWLDLSPHRRAMLEQRGVVPIDVAGHPKARDWPDNLRHERATDFIISTLEHGEPYDISKWPETPDHHPPAPPDHLEPIEKVKPNAPMEEAYPPSMESKPEDGLVHVRDLLKIWRHNRERYPGWIVAPARVRTMLISYTREWMGLILRELPSLDVVERLSAIHEIIWRHEIVLDPISAELEAVAVDALDCIDCERRSIDGRIDEEIDWLILRKSWIAVALALLTAARLRFERRTFERRIEQLSHFLEDESDIIQRIHQEKCLWQLYSLNLEAFYTQMEEWDTANCDPVWMMRKAALLFETSRSEEAKHLIEAALDAIRSAPRDDDSVALPSREGWAVYSTLDLHNLPNHQVESIWDKLTPLKCNALMEKHHFMEALRDREGRSATPAFDLGVIREPGLRISNWAFYRWTAGRRAVRLPEVAGLPPATEGVATASDLLKTAAESLAQYEPELGFRLIVRVSDFDQDEHLERIITRSRVASMPHDTIARLTDNCVTLIEYAWLRFSSVDGDHRGFWIDRLRVAMEVLSRLVVRLEPETSGAIFDKVLGWCTKGSLSWNPLFDVPFGNLLRRSWETLPDEVKKEKVLAILSAPIVGVDDTFSRSLDSPEPGNLLRHELVPPLRSASEEKRWKDTIERLIRALASSGEARERASTRISWMAIANLLSDDEVADVATALWDKDDSTPGWLPEGTSVFDWAFMLLPEPEQGLAEKRFRECWLTTERASGGDAPALEDVLFHVGSAVANLKVHKRSLTLSVKEQEYLADIVTGWAKKPIPQPIRVGGTSQSIYHSGQDVKLRNALSGLSILLLTIEFSATTADKLFEKARKLNETRIPGFSLMPGLAKALPERLEDIVLATRMGLTSDNERLARSAAYGVRLWLESSSDAGSDVVRPPIDLVREIGVAIAIRRKTIVASALEIAKGIFVSGDADQKNAIGELVSDGLSYLLEELRYDRERGISEDIPFLRWGCTHLAIAMASNGFGDDPAVIRWIDNATKDPLAEVRNARVPVPAIGDGDLSGVGPS